MRLNSISVHDFRGIHEQSLQFDGKNVIIFGINGAGKSSILRAINLLFAPIVSRLSGRRTSAESLLSADDVSYQAKQCKLAFQCKLADNLVEYSRTAQVHNGKVVGKRNPPTEFCDVFNRLYGEENGIGRMPVFVNYGVHRLVLDIPLRIRQHHAFTQLSALDKAIESKIDFRTFFEWFRYQEDLENEQKIKLWNKRYQDKALQAVRTAIYGIMDGTEHLRIERRPLSMKLDKNGIPLSINQLSDGEKGALTLFGDLSRRLALANPQLENPCEGEGVVLIDEIDLHLHPSWQRQIVPALKRTFPHVQFIITTHSPQVLGEIDDTFQIYQITRKQNDISVQQISRLDGWNSNEILEQLMNTSSQNDMVRQEFHEVFVAIKARDYVSAESKLKKLKQCVYQENPALVRAETLLQLGMYHHDKD